MRALAFPAPNLALLSWALGSWPSISEESEQAPARFSGRARSGLDPAGESPIGKAGEERVARIELPRGPHNLPHCIENECVATVKHGERRKRVQARIQ